MIPDDVVGQAVLHPVLPGAIDFAGGAMMEDGDIEEGAGRPAEHVGADFIERVPTGGLDESADFLPAEAPVDFGGTAYMERRIAGPFQFEPTIDAIADRAPADAEVGVGGE